MSDFIDRNECEKCQKYLIEKIDSFKHYIVGFGIASVFISIMGFVVMVIKW